MTIEENVLGIQAHMRNEGSFPAVCGDLSDGEDAFEEILLEEGQFVKLFLGVHHAVVARLLGQADDLLEGGLEVRVGL